MLAKLTSKNQLTLPKSVMQAVEPAEWGLTECDTGSAVAWVRGAAAGKAPSQAAAARSRLRREA